MRCARLRRSCDSFASEKHSEQIEFTVVAFFTLQGLTNMGKAQRVRDKKRRQNMTGLASVAQMEAEAKANEPLVEDGPKVPLLKKVIVYYLNK